MGLEQYAHAMTTDKVSGKPMAKHEVTGAWDFKTVTLHDTNPLTHGITRGILVGVAGNVAVTTAAGTDIVLPNLVAGVIHPIHVSKIKVTGTTATNILAVY